MNNNDMQELVGDFLIETGEIIEALDQDLVELEHRQNDLELLNKIFRGAHTMKGSSSFLGFTKLSTITHHAEEILNKLRKGELNVTREIMDVLLEFVDVTKKVVADIHAGTDTTETASLIEHLIEGNEGRLKPRGNSAPESNTSSKSTPKPMESPKPAAQTQPLQQAEQTIRVDVSRLDSLLNLVGELVLSRNRLSQISSELESKFENEYLIEQLLETTSQIGMNTTELQLAVMKTRMVPIGKVFNKFPRMVRDLSRDSGKEIDLIISGEETELDKSVVEEIGDPLIHLIRNSCDHGCELPDVRESKGKPRRGIVELKAYHEGNHIVIEIKDDGAGMDPEKLKNKAIEKKIITPEEASSMTNDQAYNLIFKPGFSTAEVVTNVSGRGVGMDVVRTNVEKLNGIISIKSELGKGSTFYLKLPLTLAIIQALLVEVGSDVFAIPLASVIETVRINVNEIHAFEGREVLKLRDRVLSLIRLDAVFGLEEIDSDEMYIVIVGLAEKQLGFIVDSLIGQEEIVIKSLGEYLGGNPGIAGATITGNGRVRLIIDVAGIIELAQSLPRRLRGKNYKSSSDIKVGVGKHNRVNVLVCDDSATDRKIAKKILETSGLFEVKEVSSGKEALLLLEKENNFSVILSDIMMPDMDGFMLARTIRERGLDIPIIAMSARTEPSDRKKMSASGINIFITKPLSQNILLEKINELAHANNSKV